MSNGQDASLDPETSVAVRGAPSQLFTLETLSADGLAVREQAPFCKPQLFPTARKTAYALAVDPRFAWNVVRTPDVLILAAGNKPSGQIGAIPVHQVIFSMKSMNAQTFAARYDRDGKIA